MTTPISEDASRYIASLDESADRTAAREYAHMVDDEFRARIGLAVDRLESTMGCVKVDVQDIKALISQPKLLMRWWKGLIGAGLLIGGTIAGIIMALKEQ